MSERWDPVAIRAGAALALLFAVPLWFAASWASTSRDSPGLAMALSFGALLAFTLGAACAAWIQRVGFPLAHGLVTAIGTYLSVQVVVTVYRIVRGDIINAFNIMFFVTLAAAAGLIGGFLGLRLRTLGFVPSSERHLDPSMLAGHHLRDDHDHDHPHDHDTDGGREGSP